MEELNAMLDDLAERVSEHSDFSVANDDDIVNNNNTHLNNNQTGNDHEKSKRQEPDSGAQDTNQGFKVYSGYGGDYNPGSNETKRPSPVPGTVQSWPEASATWTSATATPTTGTETAVAMATLKPVKDVWASTARTPLATPRDGVHCGRKHKWDTTHWGPGKGWNISTLPVYRSPSSPCNRLFSAIKETRPGREPKELLEWLTYTPRPTSRNTPAHSWLSVEGWNSSTSLSAPPTPRKKPPSGGTQTSSLDGRSSGRRQWHHQQQNVEQAFTPSKNAESTSKGSNGQQQPGSKLSKAMKEWKLSTRPQWKNTVKWNQFENITEIGRPPRVNNSYTAVKALYMKPSHKYLQLKKERELEAQHRDNLRELDMKYYYVYRDRRAKSAKQKSFLEEIGRVVS